MLLNEFLKEHRTLEKLKSTVAQQQKSFQSKLAEQDKQIRFLTAGLQKVSAQFTTANPSRGGLTVGNTAPQVAINSP